MVNALAKYVMKSMRTSLSVLHVVRAIQTSPSVDIAVIMFTFYVRVLSGAVFNIPRLFQRFWWKSAAGIQLSSILMTLRFE